MGIRYVLVAGAEYDEVMYRPGGTVYRWMQEISSEMFFHLEREVPVNTRQNKTSGEPPVGHMRAMLFSDVDQIGPHELSLQAGSRAHYTRYVVEGTSTIYARSGRDSSGRFTEIGDESGGGMYLPANPGFGPGKWRRQVRGQTANNFIGRAYDATARAHPALRGVSME